MGSKNFTTHYCALVGFAVFIFCWLLAIVDRTSRTIFTLPNVFQPVELQTDGYCWLDQSKLTLQRAVLNEPATFTDILSENPHVSAGGLYNPKNCRAFQNVAIIIPYRERESHLKVLLKRLHQMLYRQKIKYRIILVEQCDTLDFNRGLLMNIGAIEALKIDNSINCFIFHDVDLIPEHDSNIYLCDQHLRGFTVAVDENRYHNVFENYGGGVSALSRKNFFAINGFPNLYWGWGSEDDDFSARTMMLSLKMSRPPSHIGRYKMVRHVKAGRAATNYDMFRSFRGRQMIDGLNSITEHTYRLVQPRRIGVGNEQLAQEMLFTRIPVALDRHASPLNSSPIAIVSAREVSKLDNLQRRNVAIQWPFETMESVRWFLHFYGWF